MDIGDMGEREHRVTHIGGEGVRQGSAGERPKLRILRERLTVAALHRFFVLKRPMTLGVRAAAFDAEGRVFLLRHTYVGGWQLPGGGIEKGETAGEALAKELSEEGNLVLTEPAQLFGVYLNRAASPRDHVLFYRCRVVQEGERIPDREIAEGRFFALGDLPAETTPATRRRLAELGGVEPDAYW
jgi:8-oxo-dGTP pyrophosphatase MutT (NUDIX family)